MGHISNLENFVVARNAQKSNTNASDADDLAGLLSVLSHLRDDVYLNPVKTDNAIPSIEAIKMLAGTSGILLCLFLGVIASTSSEFMKRSFFNLFWYVHQILAVLFFIFFMVHGLQGVVRKQTNTGRNNPQQCYQSYSKWPSRECDLPEFSGTMATSWIWVIVPVFVYIIERLVRFLRSLRNYEVVSYILHPSNVLELRIDNSNLGKNKSL